MERQGKSADPDKAMTPSLMRLEPPTDHRQSGRFRPNKKTAVAVVLFFFLFFFTHLFSFIFFLFFCAR